MEYLIDRDKYFSFKEYPRTNNKINKITGYYAKFNKEYNSGVILNPDGYTMYGGSQYWGMRPEDYVFYYPNSVTINYSLPIDEVEKNRYSGGFYAKLFGVKCETRREKGLFDFVQGEPSIWYYKANGSTTTNFGDITTDDYVEIKNKDDSEFRLPVMSDKDSQLYVYTEVPIDKLIIKEEVRDGFNATELNIRRWTQVVYYQVFIKVYGDKTSQSVIYETPYTFTSDSPDGVVYEKEIENNSLVQEGSTYNKKQDIASYISGNIFDNYKNGRKIAELDWVGSPDVHVGDIVRVEPKEAYNHELPQYTVMGKNSKFTGGYREKLYLIETDKNRLHYGENYIKDGLVVHLDAINNIGDTHSQTATVWKDLSGNNYDGTLNGFNSLANKLSGITWNGSTVDKASIGVSYPLDVSVSTRTVDYAFNPYQFYANRSFIYNNKIYLVSTKTVEVFKTSDAYNSYKSIPLGTESSMESFMTDNGYLYVLCNNNVVYKIDCDIDAVVNTMTLPTDYNTWSSLAVTYDYSQGKYKLMVGSFGVIEQYLINSNASLSYLGRIIVGNGIEEVTDIKINGRRAYCGIENAIIEINTDNNTILKSYPVTKTKDIHYHNNKVLTNNGSDFVVLDLSDGSIKTIKSNVNIVGLSVGYSEDIGYNILYCGSATSNGFSVNLNTMEVIEEFTDLTGYWHLIGYKNYVYFTDLYDYTKVLKVGYPEKATLSTTSNVATITGHRYYLFFNYYQDLAGGNIDVLYPYYGDNATPNGVKLIDGFTSSGIGRVRRCSVVFDSIESYNNHPIAIRLNNSNSEQTVLYVNNFSLVDLTKEFGAGKEPNKVWCDSNILDDCSLGSNGISDFRNGWRGNCLQFDGSVNVTLPTITIDEKTMEVVYSIDEMIGEEQGILTSSLFGFVMFGDYRGGFRIGAGELSADIEQGVVYSQSGSIVGTSGTMKLYTNGELQTGSAGTVNTGLDFVLGNNLHGKIYSIRIYNRALSEYEVLNNLEVDKKRYGI